LQSSVPSITSALAGASDLGSLSDDLAASGIAGLGRDRANTLRALALPPRAHVLELGAGCGSLTRYLGETCGRVDAVEPDAELARLARTRTRDLPGVEVLAQTPSDRSYDIVVTGDLAALRGARARLRPGGSVIAALPNRLGVARLAGAPEPGGRPFAGVEGRGSSGATRRETEAAFRAAGLDPEVLGVFGDVRRARLVFCDALLDSPARSLAWSAPRFPSDPPVVHGASELHLWRELVRAGTGGEHANGLLVVGSTGGPPLWPAEQLAAFFSVGYRAAYMTRSRVVEAPGGVRIERARLRPDLPPPHPTLRQRCESSARWIDGIPLLDLLETAGDAELRRWVRRWRAHVDRAPRPRNVDEAPQNLIVADGVAHVVDREWFDETWTAGDVVEHGALCLALALAQRCPPERWPGCATVRDVLDVLLTFAGASGAGVIEREAAFVAHLADVDPDAQLALLQATLDLPLAAMPLGDRDHELRSRADAAALDAQAAWRSAVERGDALERRVLELEAELASQASTLAADADDRRPLPGPAARLRRARRRSTDASR
jgi:SAM-dependent methyltransferase